MIQGWEHLVIAICISYILHRLINKGKKAKAQEERFNRPIDQLEDWDDYLAKLCRITGKHAGQIFKLAAEDAGLNLGQSIISKDFRIFIHEGELPHYVIRFLEKGKDHLDKINEGPVCKTQMPGMF